MAKGGTDIGKRIRQLRESLGLSNRQLAIKAGLSQPVMNRIENGNRKADIETLEKICYALGITLIDFFSIDEEEMSPEYLELLKNAKKLSTEQLKILNDIIKNF
ncbi:Helix-turn-helix domain protein [Tepidanaerobacter acetatoxydans Re1]|uniref:Helix-turn-helix domain protein n=1 Tax=Tepidanaerobacter acetatoxydans (strain DSM 21804 / JCM 16047 / Re1) TaxID=1209989 RepID=F4LT83_TEPAE|nr:helix-turn-helix transcriptional regulator [Tepidanaerobacter acetatoxydans]AEE92483.1 helix-turn-helix domain protein [Tepidanaerobacter acetatoxydans Re1]CDI41026.1 Helix-turn-helix domain protein [Tepidanaerobacter acetatoxydans Re1]